MSFLSPGGLLFRNKVELIKVNSSEREKSTGVLSGSVGSELTMYVSIVYLLVTDLCIFIYLFIYCFCFFPLSAIGIHLI